MNVYYFFSYHFTQYVKLNNGKIEKISRNFVSGTDFRIVHIFRKIFERFIKLLNRCQLQNIQLINFFERIFLANYFKLYKDFTINTAIKISTH